MSKITSCRVSLLMNDQNASASVFYIYTGRPAHYWELPSKEYRSSCAKQPKSKVEEFLGEQEQ